MPRQRKTITYEITKLGRYLKQLRNELGFSVRHVARQCKIAPSYLAKIETGGTFKTIGIETLVKLSKFYGIPVSAMLKEAGFIDSSEDNLPELPQYLRAKYQLSPSAIRDMEMAKEIVDKRYVGLKETLGGGGLKKTSAEPIKAA
jgi:transcriptional regulator with XRE-family HTH domain